MKSLYKFASNRLAYKFREEISRAKMNKLTDTQEEDTESKLELQDEIFKLQQV